MRGRGETRRRGDAATRRRACATLLLLLLMVAGVAGKDSCVECHSAPADAFVGDVHARHGFSCTDCHGGDRNVDDPEAAMSRAKGFKGAIARTAVPALCAHCHSDANLMHRYKPQQRVDQLALYSTSTHGKRLAGGDTNVANCVDCHSVHNIREVRDPQSPVHPLNLPGTCARCHADAAHMAQYKIDTKQFEEYRSSVHWEALAKRGDLSAPSCATCHGNHGATPPQVSSVAEICGTCHVLFAELYNKSPHQPVFAAMGAAGCTVCHGNHGIRAPSDEMLAGAKSICAQCHDGTSAGGVASAEMGNLLGKLGAALNQSDAVLNRARNSGMEVSEAMLRQRRARGAGESARGGACVSSGSRGAAGRRGPEGGRRDAPRGRAGLAGSRQAPHGVGTFADHDSDYAGWALDGDPLAGSTRGA